MISDINLNLYRVFYVCAKSKTFSEASQKLCVSQPAVSKEIKELEKLLNVKLFHRDSKSVPNYDWACMYFINQYKNKFQLLSGKITEKYTSIYKSLPFENPERKEYVAKANEIRKKFKENGSKIIKDYFKKLNRKTTDIYALFISSLDTTMDDKNRSLLEFKSETLKMLKKHKISIADISALLYMRYLLTNNTILQKNVVVNESQYYGQSFINTLNKLFPSSGLTIFSRDSECKIYEEELEIVNLNYQYNMNSDIEKITNPHIKMKKL